MKKLIPWVGAAAIIFVIFGTIYGVVQQAQRNEADMPQIQIAQDVAEKLNQGRTPDSQTAWQVNMNKSLATFVIIYDKSGHIVSGSGYLDGAVPAAPYGILTNSQNKAFHRISWQPQSDVRIAAVTVSSSKYYVLSGRSLKQVENNENQTFTIAFLGGVVSSVMLGATYMLTQRQSSSRR